MLVGGWVRDALMNQATPKDVDLEVYQLTEPQLEAVLKQFGTVNFTGKSFGVYKLKVDGVELDVSFPRTERKSGSGHKGFEVTPDPHLDFATAALRRDFTINAMGYDPISQQLVDPHQGRKDLAEKRLRHVGAAFSEDPLRVLRAMQFAARFEFTIADSTVKLCRQLNLDELPMERLMGEFKKLLLKAQKPSIGLLAAHDLGILRWFPELEALQGVPQDPEWHPEGDVWVHTLMVLDEAASLRQGEEAFDLPFMLGALCHDFGKPLTTHFENGRWRSPAHDSAGLEPTERFLRRLTKELALIDKVKAYVLEHLKPALLHKARDEVGDSAIRRLATRIHLPDLVLLAQADHFGRTTADALAREFPAGSWLLERAAQLNVKDNSPQPLLMGRHLLSLGMRPGPQIGSILKEAFELQLDGELGSIDEALDWAKRKIANQVVNNV